MEKNTRPYVVCHMVSALDGKIDGEYFKMPEIFNVRNASNEIREQLSCDAVLYGAVTMAETYAEGYVKNLPAASKHYDRKNYLAVSDVRNFYVVIDIAGTIRYEGKYIEKRGRPKSHVVVVLTENVSDDYIAYLKGLDISYVFAGKDTLDCEKLMTALWDDLSIKKVMISGGGIVNWTFLQAGMIDELSLVICPVTDGGRDVATVFDRSPCFSGGAPVAFTLKSMQALPDSGVWLRYEPNNRQK